MVPRGLTRSEGGSGGVRWVPLSRSVRLLASLALLLATASALFLRLAPDGFRALPSGPSVCALKLTTGVPCLACRGTRAAFALARGDLSAAFRFNPLATLFLLAAIAGSALASLSGRWPVLPPWPAPWPALAWTSLGLALAANWAYVIAAGG